MPEPRVVAVVVTYNRRELLAECLEGLARQTRRVDEVVLVDNASTDGTHAMLEEQGFGDRLELVYLRLRRNAGCAEGYHYGVREALDRDADWIWMMDDDCEPDPDALELMLAAPQARDPDTVALTPAALSGERELLPLDRGSIRPRWFFAPLVALPAADYERPAAEIGFMTFIGPLVRAEAARRVGLPLRSAFIRNDDIEYSARLRSAGRAWVVGKSVIVHKPPRPFTDASFSGRLRDYLRPDPMADEWKHLYAIRNLVYAGRRHRFMNAAQAVAYVATQSVRRLLFGERRLRAAYLTLLFGVHGWRGIFRTVPPSTWPEVAAARRPAGYLREHALRFDEDVSEPSRPLGVRQ